MSDFIQVFSAEFYCLEVGILGVAKGMFYQKKLWILDTNDFQNLDLVGVCRDPISTKAEACIIAAGCLHYHYQTTRSLKLINNVCGH